MVAPPLLDVHDYFFFFNLFLDSFRVLQDVMIFTSIIPHKLCIINYQGQASLLHLFKLKR